MFLSPSCGLLSTTTVLSRDHKGVQRTYLLHTPFLHRRLNPDEQGQGQGWFCV